jgi:hypothetical protein
LDAGALLVISQKNIVSLRKQRKWWAELNQQRKSLQRDKSEVLNIYIWSQGEGYGQENVNNVGYLSSKQAFKSQFCNNTLQYLNTESSWGVRNTSVTDITLARLSND